MAILGGALQAAADNSKPLLFSGPRASLPNHFTFQEQRVRFSKFIIGNVFREWAFVMLLCLIIHSRIITSFQNRRLLSYMYFLIGNSQITEQIWYSEMLRHLRKIYRNCLKSWEEETEGISSDKAGEFFLTNKTICIWFLAHPSEGINPSPNLITTACKATNQRLFFPSLAASV